MRNKLPEPNILLKEKSAKLTTLIQQKIQRKNSMPFSEFMHDCLYTPTLGYYSSAQHLLGEKGDFITAPLLSSRFSDCLAKRATLLFDAGLPACILEIGGGNGQMCADILNYFEKNSLTLPRYFMLEVSADLQIRQQQTIAATFENALSHIEWVSDFPPEFSGIIFANELLDAMPVHVFTYNNHDFLEEHVALQKNGTFCKTLKDTLPLPAKQYLAETMGNFSVNYTSEINLMAAAWLKTLYQHCEQCVILLIDYGFNQQTYYHPTRQQGTLMCHYQHLAHDDVFFYPGLQDITAHVDFSYMVRAAKEAGFTLESYCTQADFLMHHGILDNPFSDPLEQYKLAQKLKMLLLPTEMGELFKVLVLGKNAEGLIVDFCQAELKNVL